MVSPVTRLPKSRSEQAVSAEKELQAFIIGLTGIFDSPYYAPIRHAKDDEARTKAVYALGEVVNYYHTHFGELLAPISREIASLEKAPERIKDAKKLRDAITITITKVDFRREFDHIVKTDDLIASNGELGDEMVARANDLLREWTKSMYKVTHAWRPHRR